MQKPHLEQFASANKDKVRLVTFNVDNPGKASLFAKYKNPSRGIPQVYVLDQNGTVLHSWVGGYPSLEGVKEQLAPYFK